MHGFSRQEHWSGLPCSAPEGLPNPGLEPTSPVAPALQADSLPMSPWGSLLKADNYVLFGGHSEDCKARRQNSWMVLRDHSEEVKKKPKYIGAFATKTRYPALKKKKRRKSLFFFFLLHGVCLMWYTGPSLVCTGFPLVAASRGYFSLWCAGLWVRCFFYHGAWALGAQASLVLVNGCSCPTARGIFPDQDPNLCFLHW